MPTMKRQYSENEIELVKAIVGLFILLPNPQLKGKEEEIFKIAFEGLDKMSDEDFQPKEDDEIYEDEYDENYDDYIKYLVEKHK